MLTLPVSDFQECDATDFDGFTSCCNGLGDKVCTF